MDQEPHETPFERAQRLSKEQEIYEFALREGEKRRRTLEEVPRALRGLQEAFQGLVETTGQAVGALTTKAFALAMRQAEAIYIVLEREEKLRLKNERSQRQEALEREALEKKLAQLEGMFSNLTKILTTDLTEPQLNNVVRRLEGIPKDELAPVQQAYLKVVIKALARREGGRP